MAVDVHGIGAVDDNGDSDAGVFVGDVFAELTGECCVRIGCPVAASCNCK